MKNIIRDIEENCEDKSVEGIVRYLHRSGDIPVTSEEYREVWFFYKDAVRMFEGNRRKARAVTKYFMKIDESKFKRIQAKYKKTERTV